MEKRYLILFICLLSAATVAGLTVTKVINPQTILKNTPHLYAYVGQKIRFLFPVKVYPGELVATVAESTGALAPEYFRRYTYTYTAQHDGNSYTQDNADFVQQKKITSNLAGGHNSIELSIAKNAPADIFICIFKNSFDANNNFLGSEWIGSFKTTD
jgi:hypothetical protein